MSVTPLAQALGLTIPATPREDYRSTFLLAMPRGGSSMAIQMVEALCRAVGVPFVNIPDELFASGRSTEDLPPGFGDVFAPAGYCYGGFRNYPARGMEPLRHPVVRAARKAVLVRDPRDALVSRYYSLRLSHAPPEEDRAGGRSTYLQRRHAADAVDLDTFCLEQHNEMKWVTRLYRSELDPATDVVIRYEDVLYDKIAFVRRLDEILALGVPDATCRAIGEDWAARGFPAREQPRAHYRVGHPGDHRRKLRPDTIAALDEVFAPFLDRFGYERCGTADGRSRPPGRAGSSPPPTPGRSRTS